MTDEMNMVFKKMLTIKNELKAFAKFYQYDPKDTLLDSYSEELAKYELLAVRSALKSLSSNAGRYFPTLAEIKGVIGPTNKEVSKKDSEFCVWCNNSGRIFAKENSTGMEYGFRCRCELGSELASIIPRWSTAKFGENYTRIK